MWNWIKSLWENKKVVIVNAICGQIDGYKPQLEKYLTDQMGKISIPEIVEKLAEDLKAYIRKQI